MSGPNVEWLAKMKRDAHAEIYRLRAEIVAINKRKAEIQAELDEQTEHFGRLCDMDKAREGEG